MKHTNEIARNILKSKYRDYLKKESNYLAEYKMIVQAQTELWCEIRNSEPIEVFDRMVLEKFEKKTKFIESLTVNPNKTKDKRNAGLSIKDFSSKRNTLISKIAWINNICKDLDLEVKLIDKK